MNTTGKYILKGREVVECSDLFEWAKSFEITNRRIAKDKIGLVTVSTIFLGLDHSFRFETMIFGGKFDGKQWRYATYNAAEAGHKLAVYKVKELPVFIHVFFNILNWYKNL